MADQPADPSRTTTSRMIAAPELVAMAVIGITLAFILTDRDWVTHDCALFLQIGQRITMGEIPCVDLRDTNPPLILYLSAVPAWIAETLGAPVILVFSLMILLLAATSAWTIWVLLRASALEPLRRRAGIMAIMPLAVTLMIWGRDYGQREHILALLMAPYFLFRALRWLDGLPTGRWVKIVGPVLGIAAGIALCLKPYHLLAVMAFEAYWVLSRRRLKPLVAGELILLAVSLAAYAVWLKWLMPLPVREAFWGTILPMVMSGYNAYNCSPENVLRCTLVPPIVVLILWGLFAASPRAEANRQLAAGFAMAGIGSLLAHVIQMKGWPYHLIPALLWSACVLAALTPSSRKAAHWAIPVGAAAVLALSVPGISVRHGTIHAPAAETVERYSRPGDRVLVLSTSLLDYCPMLLRLNRIHAARYICAWPVAGFYYGTRANADGSFPYNTTATASGQERQFLLDTAEDIRRFRPPLILIRSGGKQTASPPGFDLFEYLRQAGFIDSAMKGYRRREPIARFEVFTAIEPQATRRRSPASHRRTP